jgi:glutamate racemase
MIDFAFIDSGVGGIPYMKELLNKQPDASCVYIGDTANFPYGPKTHEQVVDCVVPLVEKIINRFEPGVIVVACNTISVNALEVLRNKFPATKFVGTVPAIKLASAVSKKRCIGLLATKATCENSYNLELKNNFAADCELVCRADGELVSFIEKNGFTASEAELEDAVRPAVDFFISKGCDVIILGCTHFLNLKTVFEKYALQQAQGPQTPIVIVDSVEGVVNHAIEISGVLGGKRRSLRELTEFSSKTRGPVSLYITGKPNSSYDFICSHYNIAFGGNI